MIILYNNLNDNTLLLYYHITRSYYNITWWSENSFSRLKFSLYIGVEGHKAGDIGIKVTSNLVKLFSCVQLFATPWAVANHAPLSIGFSRQEYWSGLPFPSPGDLLSPGIEPGFPALQIDGHFTIWATREAQTSNLNA